ncbi:hypothetical protein BKA70DRAFT_1260582 [Coprinopsis sp. MPI-PUGE-AT-0042]|nr:hypothetical protein BKA70DRAFT_1260582 [Coprinopsis sp. MPI-PUGE-AT-0042]
MAGLLTPMLQKLLLDPVFDYLEENLPPSAYSTLLSVCSYAMALFMIGAQVVGHLLAKWNWEAILPPVMTLFAAYMALTGFYRTTSWTFRLVIFCMKWGSILGTFMVGAGWLAALNGNGQQDVAENLGKLGSRAAGWLSGNGQANRATTRPRSTRKQGTKQSRPWDTKKPNYPHERAVQPELEEVQKIIQNIVQQGDQMFEGNWWWEMGKGVLGGGSQVQEQPRKKQQGRTRSR